MLAPLVFLAYAAPRMTGISPDTGPLTETTEVTIYGSNLSPPGLDTNGRGASSVLPDRAGGWGWGGGRGAEGGVDVFGVTRPVGGHMGRASKASQQVQCWFEASAGCY